MLTITTACSVDDDEFDEAAAPDRGSLPRGLGFRLRRAQTGLFRHFVRTITAAQDITPGLFGMLQVTATGGEASKRMETLVVKHEEDFAMALSPDEWRALPGLPTRLSGSPVGGGQ